MKALPLLALLLASSAAAQAPVPQAPAPAAPQAGDTFRLALGGNRRSSQETFGMAVGVSIYSTPRRAHMKDPEPTLNLAERIGVARLTRPESCLAIQGKGFKGQARGAAFDGELRYMNVDRWKPIKVADHPYDVELCDLCVQACPIKGAITLETGPAKDGSGRTVGIPVVHEPCVGCGVCEMICPVDPAAIVIDIDRIADAFVAVDVDAGTIADLNPAAATLLRVAREALLGAFDSEGRLTVTGGTHEPFYQQGYIAASLYLAVYFPLAAWPVA